MESESTDGVLKKQKTYHSLPALAESKFNEQQQQQQQQQMQQMQQPQQPQQQQQQPQQQQYRSSCCYSADDLEADPDQPTTYTGNSPTIFVSIISYRDPECQWTIKSLFDQVCSIFYLCTHT